MIPSKISFQYKSFQNELIAVVATDCNVRSGTKSGRTFHRYHTYHVKDVRAHSSAEFGMLPIGCADQLIADSCSRSAHYFTAFLFRSEDFYVF